MRVTGPIPQHKRAHRIGGWLPPDRTIIRDAVNFVVEQADAANLKLVPPVQDLANLINGNPIVYMLFMEMLTEVPTTEPYNRDSSLQPEIRDVDTLLKTINFQVQSPIAYNDSVQIGTQSMLS